jgi:nucleotide-binding universal stress UspA family protein
LAEATLGRADRTFNPQETSMKKRRILVPLDGSPISARTVQTLISMQERFTFPVTLLHVLDLSRLSYRGFAQLTFAEIEERARAKARQFLDEQQQLFAAAGLQVATLFREGDICKSVSALAESGEFDLLVMGRNPDPALQKQPFGPLANEIVNQAKCPVLII